MFSELIIAEDMRLIRLAYDYHTESFRMVGSLPIEHIARVLAFNNHLLLMRTHELILLDQEFRQIATTQLPALSAVCVDQEYVYASSQHTFVCLNKKLDEVGRVVVPIKNDWKSIHDIVVYQNIAYLLDDFSYPLAIFRINVANKQQLTLLDQAQFDTINGHLALQCLHPASKQWIVLETWAHRGEAGQAFRVYPLCPVSDDRTPRKHDHGVSRIPKGSRKTLFRQKLGRPPHGDRVRAMTRFPPHWSFLEDDEGNIHLATLHVTKKGMEFSRVTCLQELTSIAAHGDRYIMHRSEHVLSVCRTTSTPPSGEKTSGTLVSQFFRGLRGMFLKHLPVNSEDDVPGIPFLVFDIRQPDPLPVLTSDLCTYHIHEVRDFVTI